MVRARGERKGELVRLQEGADGDFFPLIYICS